MQPALYILTSAGREAELRATLRELAGSDWPESPRIICDGGGAAAEGNAIARGHLAVLQRALAEGAEHFLVLEDDVCVNRWLHHNLACWAPLRGGGLDWATLYNPGLRCTGGAGAACHAEAAGCWGAQARIFSRRCARWMVEKLRPSALRQDREMARLAAELGPLWLHRPSLVQHTGRRSTWGGPWHEAVDFDPLWRAAEDAQA